VLKSVTEPPVSTGTLDVAWKQLDIVLGFFARVESRLSLVFGVNLAMAGVLVASAPPLQGFEWYLLLGLVPLGLIGWSTWHVYRGFFPQLGGGENSLVYFRSIAERTDDAFRKEWRSQPENDRLDDVLGQIWRNSEILTVKFDQLKKSFALTAWAAAPWVICLEVFVIASPPTKSLLGR
jgi:Family of unknown function (DUF5706)